MSHLIGVRNEDSGYIRSKYGNSKQYAAWIAEELHISGTRRIEYIMSKKLDTIRILADLVLDCFCGGETDILDRP
jgi:hypothetical protein